MSEAKAPEIAAEPVTGLGARADFRATSDPALEESAERGKAELLGYRELYSFWERQQWSVGELDFSQDKIDWQQRIDAESAMRACMGPKRMPRSLAYASRKRGHLLPVPCNGA